MKTILKSILLLALCAATSAHATATCGTGSHSNYYKFSAMPDKSKLQLTLQGYGKQKIPASKPKPGDTRLAFDIEMTSDCKFTGSIYSYDPADPIVSRFTLFGFAGSWSYPAESKSLYFAISGDISEGSASTGTWGGLFSPTDITGIQGFYPVLFSKTQSIAVIHPSVTQKAGTVQFKKDGTAIVSMGVTGRSIVTDKAKLTTRESTFSFAATTSSTVSTTPPIP